MATADILNITETPLTDESIHQSQEQNSMIVDECETNTTLPDLFDARPNVRNEGRLTNADGVAYADNEQFTLAHDGCCI